MISARSIAPDASLRTRWNATVAPANIRKMAVMPICARPFDGSSSCCQNPNRNSEPTHASSVNQRQFRKLASASTPTSSTSTYASRSLSSGSFSCRSIGVANPPKMEKTATTADSCRRESKAPASVITENPAKAVVGETSS